MGNPEMKDLFYKTRFIGGWHLLGAVFYAPVGFMLAMLRVFMSLQAYLLALLLLIPELALIRKYILRAMCLVLGIFVVEENGSLRDKSVRVLMSNQISILDHIPVHLFTGCFSPSQWDVWPLCMKVFAGASDKQRLATSLRSHLNKSASPLLLQPEETCTSGRVGLLRFASWCMSVAPSASVQPVSLQLWRPLGISASTLTSSPGSDLFWFLFSPITVFRLRYLPVVQRAEGETDEEMSDRIAETIAKDLGIESTKFTAKDKEEYEKRYRTELSEQLSRSRNVAQSAPRATAEMQRMVAQVQEVLPYVPYQAVIRDIMRTRSVDLTISNILEGAVRFTPLPPEQRPGPSVSASTAAVSSSEASSSSSVFPRSAQDRMMSFVERKARLIEDARRRYMEKHGLVDTQQT